MTVKNTNIWIDLDNSPHVPFFKPIIEELKLRGVTVVVTARDCFQVCGLADYHNVPYEKIGRHYGKNKVIKVLGLIYRAMQMAPLISREKPALALSHGSRSQGILAKFLGIPNMIMTDYEHAKWLFFARPYMLMVPEVIPDSAIHVKSKNLAKYPGIKEDVYAPTFKPQPGLLEKLGIDGSEVVVTIRPPATEAHYHRPESDDLFDAVIDQVSNATGTRMILLPRNDHQASAIKGKWPDLFDSKKVIIPDHVIDGLNLIWHSDLVISGGGTMNREAAALGVPVYSIFRGETGNVDKYLASCDRLTMVENAADVKTKIKLNKWNHSAKYDGNSQPALRCIVDKIMAVLEECS